MSEAEHIPDLVQSDGPDELIEVVGKWLKDEKARLELARRQQEHAHKLHTYEARCRALLGGLG